MFLGEYQHTLDAKGRVSLPAKFRSEMTGSVVISKGLEGSLYVFPAEDYSAFLQGLLSQDDFDPQLRKVRRYFTSGAVETELDSAGRVTVPPVLREWAGLVKDVTVTGNGTRIELWDSAKWASYNEAGDSIEDLTKELAGSGLL